MSDHRHNFTFSPSFNFAVHNFFNDNVFTQKYPELANPFPPAPGDLLITDRTGFLLTDGTNFLLAS